MQKAYSVFFSPTGTTERVANAIAAGTGLPHESIDLTILEKRRAFRHSFEKNDLVIAGMPVYGGRIPRNLDDFFTGLDGHGAPAVALVVYGNREYEDALIEMKTRLEERGFQVMAGAAFIGEHTFSRKIATGRPDEDDLVTAREFGKKIADIDLSDSRKLTVKGNYPFITRGFDPANPDRPFFPSIITTDECTACGLCAEECPWGAIDTEDYSQVDTLKCLRCFRCIRICPVSAKKAIGEKFYEFLPRFEARLGPRRKEPELFLPE
jgi:ferredoxin